MSSNPYEVVKTFERAICDYTGATYCVAVNSCSMALTLAVAWHLREINRERMESDMWQAREDMIYPGAVAIRPSIEIPKRTYVSVPMAIIHAGGRPTFRDEDWIGMYRLHPFRLYDSARLFTSKMFKDDANKGTDFETPPGKMMCVSFHASKTLGIEQGGAILHDNKEADAWLRRARFDGRTEGVAPKDDTFTQVGWHCYMSPSVAAQGLLKLHSLPRHNEPLQNDEYPDLSKMEIFK